MRLKWRKSITFQLTVLFASASTVVLLVLGLFIEPSVERHFVSMDLEVLSGEMKFVREAVEGIDSSAGLAAFPELIGQSVVGHQGLAVLIAAADGGVLYATPGSAFPAHLLDDPVSGEQAGPMVWQSTGGKPLRGISARAFTGIDGLPPLLVAVAVDISMHEHYRQSFRLTLWSFVVLAALATGLFGWFAARRGLAPFLAIKREAADITAHRLHARLPVDSVPVELRDLVETLNEMLARLENSFRQLSDFSSDIAHELRTPVSNLLTQTQVVLSRDRTADEYRDVLASNVEELERLSRMISDMLFLAKSENQLIVPQRERLDLSAEVQNLVDFYEAVAEEKAITVVCSGSGVVVGDRLMLRRAISNLLSNALRHTPQGGRIAIRLDDTSAPVVKLAVENSGAGIAPEHLLRLFDRFYRVDASRQQFTDGAGLGLAITLAIVRAHGGDAFVRSAAGVTVFELLIPV